MGGTAASSTLAREWTGPISLRTWIPCIGMGLCSWLSFVDRQIFAVLAPTILRDTGMSTQDFGNLAFYFFLGQVIGTPLWGSILDFIGLRIGMLLAVGVWTAASASHAWMSAFLGFAAARFVLGLGEGATFPGGLRTAVESLPSNRRASGIATSFSGGTFGAIVTPLIVVPVAARFGWRATFLVTGLLGTAWLVLWASVARYPFLPKVERRAARLTWPNPLERRFWAIVFSYALPAISVGPILTIVPLYLSRGLGLSQAELGRLLWMPPLGWGLGYFFWGWAADRWSADNPRPVGMFVVLTVLALPFGAITRTTSVSLAMLLISWSAFVAGGFQMVSLKVGSYAYPREQAAMMSATIASASWALLNAVLSPVIGRLFQERRYGVAFWLIAICPVIGIAGWLLLSRSSLRRRA
jgi:ACS family hexuronate transporter-like MFS transporter